jgi:hypothetical protein
LLQKIRLAIHENDQDYTDDPYGPTGAGSSYAEKDIEPDSDILIFKKQFDLKASLQSLQQLPNAVVIETTAKQTFKRRQSQVLKLTKFFKGASLANRDVSSPPANSVSGHGLDGAIIENENDGVDDTDSDQSVTSRNQNHNITFNKIQRDKENLFNQGDDATLDGAMGMHMSVDVPESNDDTEVSSNN